MTIGIAGLGLIGGSFTRAYAAAGVEVLAFDTDRSTLDFALLAGAAHGVLTRDNVATCDLVLVSLYPRAAVEYVSEMASFFGPKPLVMDCCGTKRAVCAACFPLAEEHGFPFVGGHPMAGDHNSGFKFSRLDLFHGAPMVLVPPDFNDIALLGRAKSLLAPAGFGRFSVTTAEKHDEVLAFTSQLAHLVSNAYIKSPTASRHEGFSAGSYRDLTRVAWLNPGMWAELFLENKDCLLAELDTLQSNLAAYRAALAGEDLVSLTALLEEGRRRKEEVDGL